MSTVRKRPPEKHQEPDKVTEWMSVMDALTQLKAEKTKEKKKKLFLLYSDCK